MDKKALLSEDKYLLSIFGGLGVGRTSLLDILMEKYDFGFQEAVIVFDYNPFSYKDFLTSYSNIKFDFIDLILFIVDIQNRVNSVRSAEFLDALFKYFKKNKIKIPTIVLFHKYDPELRAYYDHDLQDRATSLRNKVLSKHRKLQLYFQETSIHDKKSIEELFVLITRLSRIKLKF